MISTNAMAGSLSDNPYVKMAENWLTNLKTATAQFQQIDDQGGVMRGNFYIKRPGRLRFEYDAPTKDFIVADGVQIHFYDGETDQFNSAPIGMTLADFILRDTKKFDENITIQSVRDLGETVNITISQTDQPDMGSLILKFAKSPFTLQSWDIMDAQGFTTSIVLRNFKRDIYIPASMFRVKNRNLNE